MDALLGHAVLGAILLEAGAGVTDKDDSRHNAADLGVGIELALALAALGGKLAGTHSAAQFVATGPE